MILRWCVTLFLFINYWPTALAAIQYSPEKKVWVLQAGETTYAMGVNERGELQSIYWGGRVARDADFSTPHSRPEVASFDLSNYHHSTGISGLGRGALQRAGAQGHLRGRKPRRGPALCGLSHRGRHARYSIERYRLGSSGSSVLPHF